MPKDECLYGIHSVDLGRDDMFIFYAVPTELKRDGQHFL